MKRGGSRCFPLFSYTTLLSYCHNVTKLGLAQDVAYKVRLNKNVA